MTILWERTTPVGLLLSLSFLSACGGPTNFYAPLLRIDPGLHLAPGGPRSVMQPDLHTTYFFFHGASGTAITHTVLPPGSRQRQTVLFLEADHKQQLIETSKWDKLLEGPFGTVYALRNCFYTYAAVDHLSSVAVAARPSGGGEKPAIVPVPAGALPPLTSLSLVRIFRVAAGYRLIAANYESDGRLGSIDISGARDGSWYSPPDGGDFLYVGPPDSRLERYGIPPRIDVEQYLHLHRLQLPSVALPEETTVLNQHFGFNKVIRQDTLQHGAIASSIFLQPSITEEERQLGPACDQRLRQQQATKTRTVE